MDYNQFPTMVSARFRDNSLSDFHEDEWGIWLNGTMVCAGLPENLARRIAVAFNACKGISTDQVETLTFREILIGNQTATITCANCGDETDLWSHCGDKGERLCTNCREEWLKLIDLPF